MSLMESEVGNRIKEAIETGTTFKACKNSMRVQKVSEDGGLYPGVDTVELGVGQIIKRQGENWAYITL
jgi:intracellular sulfur oxidation DsrE/DsrF family protein